MSLQICLLRTGESIVGDVREVIDKEKNEFIGYKVNDPFVVELTDVSTVSVVNNEVEQGLESSAKVVFRQWAPLSQRMEFQFTKDFVEVIYPPCRDVEESYLSILADYITKRKITAVVDPETVVVSGEHNLMKELQKMNELPEENVVSGDNN